MSKMFPFLRKFSLAGQINGSLVSEAIAKVETSTSAEIRVHFTTCPSKLSLLEEAQTVFNQLQMHKTESRNGVLGFLRLKSKEIAVIGDEGIHQKVGAEFWEAVKEEIIETIHSNNLNDGIVRGVEVVGKQLSKHFPPSAENPNELSNEVTSSRGFF
jgi:uncharacterized membrane protein